MSRPTTVSELRSDGYPDRSVKQELRDNLLARLNRGERLVSDVVGFDESVLPDLERGVLAGHDLIFLGERGQAKTRIVRQLAGLLDETVPVVAGCEVNCHPYHPVCARCRALADDDGDDLAVEWIGRDERYGEKLATPDTSVGDLIGDVDPIRVAEGRYLADEETIHFGLVPRTNRGIFAVNELPDLPGRIQVALLNVLEERDIQVRGYKIRLPLDVLLVATANPDDYTNRGRIISPLKDRFGTQIRTHYPRRADDEIAIMRQEVAPPPEQVDVRVPRFLEEVLAELARQLRDSAQINQRSGVSVRYSIGGRETLVAGAVRRAARAGESEAVPRVVDLWPVVPAALGRIEFDTLEEGRETEIVARLLRKAILVVWRRHLGGLDFASLVERFEDGLTVTADGTMSATAFLDQFKADQFKGDQFDGDAATDGPSATRRAERDTSGGRLTGLASWMEALDVPAESPIAAASVVEFVLEGLHLAKRLNKDQTGIGGWRYAGG